MFGTFRSSAFGRVTLASLMLLGTAGFATAADPVVDAAQAGIANYSIIIAISQMCSFDLDKSTKETVVANVGLLMPKAKFTDKDMDDVLAGSIATLSKDKDKYCGPGLAVFKEKIPIFEKLAIEAAKPTGVSLKPLTVAATPAKDPKELAAQMLDFSIMAEAISDECKFKLKDGESLAIDRAEYYWRGKADYTAKQFEDLQTKWEEDLKKSHEDLQRRGGLPRNLQDDDRFDQVT